MKHNPNFMDPINADLQARKAARQLLEVEEFADKDELKRAYRKAAIKYHPDHSGNTDEANKKFILVKCAYELLAFNKYSDELLGEINSWQGIEGSKYKTDNPWGHFLWWQEQFFSGGEKKTPIKKKNDTRANSCI